LVNCVYIKEGGLVKQAASTLTAEQWRQTRKEFLINSMESLILAQDERWRRA
jgi:hypothetical protein